MIYIYMCVCKQVCIEIRDPPFSKDITRGCQFRRETYGISWLNFGSHQLVMLGFSKFCVVKKEGCLSVI